MAKNQKMDILDTEQKNLMDPGTLSIAVSIATFPLKLIENPKD